MDDSMADIFTNTCYSLLSSPSTQCQRSPNMELRDGQSKRRWLVPITILVLTLFHPQPSRQRSPAQQKMKSNYIISLSYSYMSPSSYRKSQKQPKDKDEKKEKKSIFPPLMHLKILGNRAEGDP